jgi:hypothetical protein
MLTHLASEYSGNADDEKNFKDVLAYIDRESLLPPLMVVQIVATNPMAPLGLVYDFIIKRLTTEDQQITEDKAHIKQFKEETERNREKIKKCVAAAHVAVRCRVRDRDPAMWLSVLRCRFPPSFLLLLSFGWL